MGKFSLSEVLMLKCEIFFFQNVLFATEIRHWFKVSVHFTDRIIYVFKKKLWSMGPEDGSVYPLFPSFTSSFILPLFNSKV